MNYMDYFNRIMDSDSYKFSHYKQYPEGTVSMYDYGMPRYSKIYDKVVFVGLQYILKKYYTAPFTIEEVQEANEYAEFHGIPFNLEGWMYIINELKGVLPVVIKAVPEGCLIPIGLPLFTIERTDPKVFWIASWLETSLLRVWYTCNVATISYNIKQTLMNYAEDTQDNPFVDFSLLNFGARGSSSSETSAIGGLAHLTQFKGTDNFSSLKLAHDYYNQPKGDIGWSIEASEHSSTTAHLREGEFDMIMNHLENNKGKALVACVIDSYDVYNATKVLTSGEFKTKIESNDYPKMVLRPDSGEPIEVITKMLEIMENNNVGYIINSKGFKVFNKYSILFGDGINSNTIDTILSVMYLRGYSSENFSFGMGGALMQGSDNTSNNRDTMGWALKCSSITLETENGIVERDVFKDPITDKGKTSLKGKVTTYYNPVTETYFIDKVNADFDNSSYDVLETVFENGKMIKEYTLSEVRDNINLRN